MSGKVRSTVVGKNGKARTKWEWRDPIEMGSWEMAEERPDLANEDGSFTLDKGNGTKINAAYNPYIHTSRSPINDQFSSAWKRPELVTVEVEVPESELTSGYRAKDAVGEVEWKSGTVSNALAKTGNPRRVILSRYDRPVREVPVREVAEEYARRLDGKDIEVPFNTVSPELRDALARCGVKIGAPEGGNAGGAAMKAYEAWSNGEDVPGEEGLRFRKEDTESDSEELQIVKRAKSDGSYMKAPNGKPTKLSEKQWVQVRTEAFKKWFGDWEKGNLIKAARGFKPTGDSPYPSYADGKDTRLSSIMQVNSSKVLDENGEPMVMHHGTQLQEYYYKDGYPYTRRIPRFNEFQSWKGYFTPNEEAASTFANGESGMYHTYIAMHNPLEIDAKGADWDEII
jgi:hypothetical protein